jgi:outer membrane protein assembly factor BamB
MTLAVRNATSGDVDEGEGERERAGGWGSAGEGERERAGGWGAVNAEAGTRFGRYRLLRTIASDAVSTTHFATTDGGRQRARARSTAVEHYAIRIAAPVDPKDQQAVEMVRRYLSEAQQAGVVDHPTVVRPHDLGIVDGRPYVATPFIRAVPLGELLAHGGTINQPAALAMFAQLAAALDAAHRAGVVHGALSPRTIWVGPSMGEGAGYVAYLTGFGTASLLRHHMEQAPPGPPVEDVLYVAPEQLRGEQATGGSDQYALACAVYHTLAGRPPFERETRSKLYGAHLLAPPPALDARDSVGAPTTRAALLRAMSKTPDERYATCGALIHEALPVDPPKPARFAGTGRRRASWRRTAPVGGRRSWWPFAVAALALVAGAAVWTAFWSDDTRGPGRSAGQTTPRAETRPVTEPRMTAASTARRIAWDVSVTSRPITHIEVLDGGVVVLDERGMVVADTSDGAVRWRRDTGGPTGVATDRDLVVHGGDALTAVDTANGDPRWTADDVAPVLALALTDREVVAAAGDPSAPQIAAVDRAAGTPMWRTDLDADARAAHSEGERQPAGGRGPAALMVADADTVYMLGGGQLAAIEVSPDTAGGQPGRLAWRMQVAAWPVLAAVGDAVIVATEDGRVCRHAATEGAVLWCEVVPGVEAQAPRLFVDGRLVVVATSEAVMGLDARTGRQEWGVSPGSPTNQVAVGSGRVVIGDHTGLRVLEAGTGDASLELPDLGNVTAVAVGGGRLYVGSAEGSLMALDLGIGN